MKILLVQEAGRHPENYLYRECLCFKRAFEHIDSSIECVLYGRGFNSIEGVLFNCDIIFIIENYSYNEWLPNLANIDKPKIFWSIDAHVAYEEHLKFCRYNKIDVVLVAPYNYVNKFQKEGFLAYWLPGAYPSDLIKPSHGEKLYNLGFCGSVGLRNNSIIDLSRRFNIKKDINVLGDSMVSAINSYKIHWNMNRADDINYRTFETAGCGTCLITNDTPGLGWLFNLEEDLVTYNTFDECVDKIKFLLKHESEIDRIAKNGFYASQLHTYYERSRQFLSIVKECF
jgi:hypothetical protein